MRATEEQFNDLISVKQSLHNVMDKFKLTASECDLFKIILADVNEKLNKIINDNIVI